jgi:hypothetical protein
VTQKRLLNLILWKKVNIHKSFQHKRSLKYVYFVSFGSGAGSGPGPKRQDPAPDLDPAPDPDPTRKVWIRPDPDPQHWVQVMAFLGHSFYKEQTFSCHNLIKIKKLSNIYT